MTKVKYRAWQREQDARLMDLIADGCTMQRCADLCGITRNAAIGRFHRIRHEMGWQAS
jgi:hypothetical protein